MYAGLDHGHVWVGGKGCQAVLRVTSGRRRARGGDERKLQ